MSKARTPQQSDNNPPAEVIAAAETLIEEDNPMADLAESFLDSL